MTVTSAPTPGVRKGFTLIELLLVLIATIANVPDILLPAVQNARKAAARMSCTNNLKHLAIACHNYHDVNGTLPFDDGPGGVVATTPPSIFVQILPYVEQTALYQQMNAQAGGGLTNWIGNQTLANAAAIKTFLCPGRRISGLGKV